MQWKGDQNEKLRIVPHDVGANVGSVCVDKWMDLDDITIEEQMDIIFRILLDYVELGICLGVRVGQTSFS